MKFIALLLSISLLTSSNAYAQSTQDTVPPESDNTSRELMTQAKMANIIKELVDETQGPDNNLSFVYDGVSISMVSDDNANRMRLVTPITAASEMSEQQVIATLVSNFHLALDARYAIGNGVLFSTYIHPLAELSRDQLISAVRQVSTLSKTFGSSYTSGELTFGVQTPEEERIEI